MSKDEEILKAILEILKHIEAELHIIHKIYVRLYGEFEGTDFIEETDPTIPGVTKTEQNTLD